jgi:hypothetical protein
MVAQSARATPSVRGELAPLMAAVWSGEAAAAAVEEGLVLARRAGAQVDAITCTGAALERYATALDTAYVRVLALQRNWDELDASHLLALSAARLAGGDLDLIGAQHRLRVERDEARTRLSQAHAAALDDLRRAALVCAGAIARATETTVPPHVRATAEQVRERVTKGLPLAEGLARDRESRAIAVRDAALLRTVASSAPSTAADSAVRELVARLDARRLDPAYAQALFDEAGADVVGRLVTQATADHLSLGGMHGLLGVLGSLVLTASSGGSGRAVEAGTRRRLDSGAALFADALVRATGRVSAATDGQTRQSGSWVLGQTLVAAHRSGDGRRLPPALAARLTAVAAAAEAAETRDADTELRHGTTMRANGDYLFASWFEHASETGDAVHVLMSHVGHDPSAVAALLATPLADIDAAGGALDNARGDRLTVAEQLARRWVTYEATGTESHPDLQLATDADLTRLVAVAEQSSPRSAETRARIMVEVGRTSAYAVDSPVTAAQHERAASGRLESTVVEWLAGMRDSVDATLALPFDGGGYTRPGESGPQPRLLTGELVSVVQALALGSTFALRAQQPADHYRQLLAGELGHVRDRAGAGDVSSDLVRIGFFEAAAAAGLVVAARRQDDANRQLLRGAMDAKSVMLEARAGPGGLVSAASQFVQEGTARTALDELVVSLLRSDVELAQTVLQEQRREDLVEQLRALTGDPAVAAVLALGASHAPALATSQELRRQRAAEIRAAYDAVRDEATMDRLASPPGHRRTDRSDIADPRLSRQAEGPGSIDLSRVTKVKPHEQATAERLARAGHDVEFIPRRDTGKSADAFVDGELWEFKAPTGNGSQTVVGLIRSGREQSSRIVIDLSNSELTVEQAMQQIDYSLRRYDGLTAIRVITKNGQIIDRKA